MLAELARCPVGEVRVTGAHEIPLARWVLHTVAPLYGEGEAFRFDELNRCYSECLRAAAANWRAIDRVLCARDGLLWMAGGGRGRPRGAGRIQVGGGAG